MSHRIYVILLISLLATVFVSGSADAASACDSAVRAKFDATAAATGLLDLAVDEDPEKVIRQTLHSVPSRGVEVIETLVRLPDAGGSLAALFRLQRTNGSPLAEVAVAPPTCVGEIRRFETVVRWHGTGPGGAISHAADRYEVVTDPDPEEGGYEVVTDPDPEEGYEEATDSKEEKLLGPQPSRVSEWRFVLVLDATLDAEEARLEILGWLIERLWADHQSPPGPGGIRLVGFTPIR